MQTMSQQTLTIPPFKPLLEANYEILFFDEKFNLVLIAPWDIRNYNLTFDEYITSLDVTITGLSSAYEISQFRAIKYIKIRHIDDEENQVSEYSFEVVKMSGSMRGDYSSDQWMAYQIKFAVK